MELTSANWGDWRWAPSTPQRNVRAGGEDAAGEGTGGRLGAVTSCRLETERDWLGLEMERQRQGLSGRDMLPKATASPLERVVAFVGKTLGRAPHDAGAVAEPLEPERYPALECQVRDEAAGPEEVLQPFEPYPAGRRL